KGWPWQGPWRGTASGASADPARKFPCSTCLRRTGPCQLRTALQGRHRDSCNLDDDTASTHPSGRWFNSGKPTTTTRHLHPCTRQAEVVVVWSPQHVDPDRVR